MRDIQPRSLLAPQPILHHGRCSLGASASVPTAPTWPGMSVLARHSEARWSCIADHGPIGGFV